VPASELHADTIAEEAAAANPNGADANERITIGDDGVEFQLVGENGEVLMRSNRETIDDSARQTLTMEEIEELKREGTGAGKDLIAKLMASHLGIEQKTAFSLAKYKLLKTKKYLKRFTILPLDVPMLVTWMIEERDSAKILELRAEMLALLGSWSNVHFAEAAFAADGGRWLVVDETGGLIVAALAEKMGILYQNQDEDAGTENHDEHPDPPLATSNTITLIHNNAQPNLALLKYFSWDPTSGATSPYHPLSTHLHPISWLQLTSPTADSTYSTPIEILSPAAIAEMKSGKRGTYYRKLRRHIKVRSIVDTTLQGHFDGLVIASNMDPISVMRHTIHLLRGGAPIAIYSPTIEPLTALADVYSTSRRTAFIQAPPASFTSLALDENANPDTWPGDEDFPLNPTLLLNTCVQSARVRDWQVLPGRTHPVMTGKGGAEGYLFTAVKVVPAAGKVEARGKFSRKRTAASDDPTVKNDAQPAEKKHIIDWKVSGEEAIDGGASLEDVDMGLLS
jgi:tRNA (adenine-N(1)-)-methyltransferase non-catalytic subunit